MKALISALPGVFDAIDASDEVREAFVFVVWRHVAGPQIAERTAPVAVEDGKLAVAVPDKAWKLNLESLAGQLLYKLNSALGRETISFLDFRVLPDRIADVEPVADRQAVDPDSLPAELAASLEGIRDDSLRQKLSLAAAACLSRRQDIQNPGSESIS